MDMDYVVRIIGEDVVIVFPDYKITLTASQAIALCAALEECARVLKRNETPDFQARYSWRRGTTKKQDNGKDAKE